MRLSVLFSAGFNKGYSVVGVVGIYEVFVVLVAAHEDERSSMVDKFVGSTAYGDGMGMVMSMDVAWVYSECEGCDEVVV